MRHQRSRVLPTCRRLVVLAALIVACAPAPAPPPPAAPPTPEPTPITYEPVKDVQDAPRSVLAELGFEITESEAEKGTLTGTRRVVTQNAAERRAGATELRRISYIEETHLLEGDRQLEEYTVTVQMRLGSAESEVSVSAKAGIVVVVRAGGQAKPISRPIPSRGVLEKELIGKVQQSFEE